MVPSANAILTIAAKWSLFLDLNPGVYRSEKDIFV
jgi:hypothetical protein